MINKTVSILENKIIGDNQYLLRIEWSNLNNIKCGNFFMIGINDNSKILKRPIAIFDINEKDNSISFVYNVIGKGTKELSDYKAGDKIDVLGPVGNSFKEYENKNILLVGGGTGIFPLHFFVKKYANKNNITMILGFRSKRFFNTNKEFHNLNSKLIICTDDGSLGIKGNPIDELESIIKKEKPEVILTCGPEILMHKTYLISKRHNIKTFGSFERRMGCGFGVCMGCSIATKKGMKRVCYDGPIFDMDDLEINNE